jgi:predicted transcriptional regulator with HTH domain
VFTLRGPQRSKLVKKILRILKKYPEGIWVRKLARELNEPISTIHKYVMTDEEGYPGEQIEIVKRLPTELGGNVMIKLKRK